MENLKVLLKHDEIYQHGFDIPVGNSMFKVP